LVSDSDVKSYKQIKDDLDGLRLLVEKSELWVFKSKSSEEKTGKSGPGAPNSGNGPSGSGQSAPLANGVPEEDEGESDLKSLEEKVKHFCGAKLNQRMHSSTPPQIWK
jgi:inositol 1,4,5-triphosphate receptor type 1